MDGLTLLIGGARSGKSDLAVQMGQRHGNAVTFIATAEALDDDMARRIARHRAERPPWPTIVAPLGVGDALCAAPADHLVIVDCLTLWLANALLGEWTDDAILAATASDALIAAARPAPTVVVTNEVGLGIHPDNELGRRYRDLLGRVNRHWAGAARRSLFLVAGRAVPLHNPWEFLT